MRNTSAGIRLILVLQAVGGVATFVALAAFAYSGSLPVAALLYPAAGGTFGGFASFLLTRPRGSGRVVAGFLLWACASSVCAFAATAVSRPGEVNGFLLRNAEASAFASTLLVGVSMVSLFRLLGSKETSGPPDDR